MTVPPAYFPDKDYSKTNKFPNILPQRISHNLKSSLNHIVISIKNETLDTALTPVPSPSPLPPFERGGEGRITDKTHPPSCSPFSLFGRKGLGDRGPVLWLVSLLFEMTIFLGQLHNPSHCCGLPIEVNGHHPLSIIALRAGCRV